MSNELEGKRAVVTAGADGIGRAIARAFMAAGARVHVCDVDGEKLAAFEAEAPSLGATLADVADPAQVDRLFMDAAAALGGLDILINNAGIAGPTGPIESLTPEDWRRCIDVNLNGQFYCLRRAVPLLRAAGGGSIVNLSSSAGLLGFPNRTPYAASKWAVVGITKSLAIELGPDHIRVNAICPGSVAGERIDRVIAADAGLRGLTPAEVRAEYAGSMSLGTFIDPEDIAAMALFICSDAGAKISGQALAVDGNTESLAR
ncbi:MAG: SDR family oxidoreductase [Proteobacteria bacterium]|nr:SDR family oxidoreductase [Pseudomonadota bacterium]